MSTKFQKDMPGKYLIPLLFFFLLYSSLSAFSTQVPSNKFEEPQIENTDIKKIAKDTSSEDGFFNILSEKNKDKDDKKKKKKKKDAEINANFYINLLIDLVAMLLIIGLIYYPNYRRLDTIFTFVLFNITIYLLTFLLNQVKISMGAAFGLFAVFSMLRYRTAGISVKDMTYLFVFIAMGLLSGIQLEIGELLIVFAVMIVMIFVFDTKLLIKREANKTIYLEDIELTHIDRENDLIEELKKRTGLNIHRVMIKEISYLRDSATVKIYYYE